MELTPDQVRAFVGPNADYYLARWERMDQQKSRALGFNWPAFFGSMSWLVYRRMYLWFWMVFVVWFGSVVLAPVALFAAIRADAILLVSLITLVLGIMGLSFPVMLGIYGNYWYYLHARRQVGRLTPAGQADLQAVGRMGGTNITAAVASGIVIGFIWSWASHATHRRVPPTTRPHISQELAPRPFLGPWQR